MMRNIRKSGRLLTLLGIITAAMLAVAGIAWAFWSSTGNGAASATTATLNAPTNVAATATPGSGTVAVAWAGSTLSTGQPASGYYVTRTSNSDAVTAAACGTSSAAPTASTSCSDTSVPDGTYHYVVTAVYATWTATSASSSDVTVVNDNIPPSVSVDQAARQADPTKASPITFTVVFSEAVSDFTSADVSLGGTAPGAMTVTVTGSGTTYNVAVSGMTGSGTVIASIAADAAHDAAGNGNTASTSTDHTVTYDVTAPTVPAPVATAAITSGTNPMFVNNEVVTLTDAATDASSAVKSVSYYYCAGSTGSCTSSNWTLIGSSTTSLGNFSVTSNAPLAATDGPYRIVAVATDDLDNTSGSSVATLITVDTTPPTVSRPTVNGHS